ncbi:hypothetical protein VTO73DRAFT_6425 [Trametes versicolor]
MHIIMLRKPREGLGQHIASTPNNRPNLLNPDLLGLRHAATLAMLNASMRHGVATCEE